MGNGLDDRWTPGFRDKIVNEDAGRHDQP